MSEKKFPKVTVGVYILNKKGEILFINSGRWAGLLIPPGGHIEYGETMVEAAIREVKEETGLDIKDVEYLKTNEAIKSKELSEKKHYVFLELGAKLVDESQEVVLDDDEGTGYVWLKPEEVLEHSGIESLAKNVIADFFVKKDKKKLFKSKKCENCEEYKAGWQRAQADYQNLQREIQDKKHEWLEYSKGMILEEFIPIYENFKKAFAVDTTNETSDDSNKKWESWKQGVGFIMKQFGDVLKSQGVEEIKTVGEQFDHHLHEAVGEEDGEESGLILKEVEGGYKMGEKVIRVAKVIVAK